LVVSYVFLCCYVFPAVAFITKTPTCEEPIPARYAIDEKEDMATGACYPKYLRFMRPEERYKSFHESWKKPDSSCSALYRAKKVWEKSNGYQYQKIDHMDDGIRFDYDNQPLPISTDEERVQFADDYTQEHCDRIKQSFKNMTPGNTLIIITLVRFNFILRILFLLLWL
jgi:hypothetical protein